MTKSTVLAATLAVLGLAATHPGDALAASAKHPYRHVNHMNDKGNPTGDVETDKLNQAQLDQNRPR